MHRSPSELYIVVRRDKLVLMQTFLPYMGHVRLCFSAFILGHPGRDLGLFSILSSCDFIWRSRLILFSGLYSLDMNERFHGDDRQ